MDNLEKFGQGLKEHPRLIVYDINPIKKFALLFHDRYIRCIENKERNVVVVGIKTKFLWPKLWRGDRFWRQKFFVVNYFLSETIFYGNENFWTKIFNFLKTENGSQKTSQIRRQKIAIVNRHFE